MASWYCPDCGGRIQLDGRPWIGQPVFCPRCDADLEVVETNPLRLELTDNLLEDSWERDWQAEVQMA
jgi:lysine biosynthesis protein LysW